MKSQIGILAACAVALVSTIAVAQSSTMEIKQLTDQLYLLSTDQGEYTTNTIAFVGDDGILLVDTQAENDAEELKKAVEAFGKGPPKFIINTHCHVEHIGGNAIFGHDPVVIAHELVPERLRSGSYLFAEFPDETFPDITLADSLTLFFNGERIRIIALPGSHDDNEIIVHFTRSKVVHLSSLVNGFNFPSVDSKGDVLKFREIVAKAIEILPQDVVIVSGHNDTGTWRDLLSYHEMLLRTTEMVSEGLSKGKDLSTLQKEKLLAEWDRYAGSYVSTDRWIEYLVKGLQKTTQAENPLFDPLYHAWKADGADAAVEYYFELKRGHEDEAEFRAPTLLLIGDKLLNKNHLSAAVKFLEASLLDQPSSKYSHYASFELADAYDKLGKKELAKRFCERALELKPGFAPAEELLRRITAE